MIAPYTRRQRHIAYETMDPETKVLAIKIILKNKQVNLLFQSQSPTSDQYSPMDDNKENDEIAEPEPFDPNKTRREVVIGEEDEDQVQDDLNKSVRFLLIIFQLFRV